MNKPAMLLMGVLAAALGTAFAAADGPKEIDTALDHAQMAAAATDLKTVDMHLHHVVNCLVGTKGKGYDAAAGNPCKDMGDGALNDSGEDKALHTKLESALSEADLGLKDKDYDSAKKIAAGVVERLKSATKANK